MTRIRRRWRLIGYAATGALSFTAALVAWEMVSRW